MDRDAFDGLTRLLAASPSRRAALGALAGVGLAATLGGARATKRNRKQRTSGSKAKGAAVAAEASCASPGHGQNLSGCDYAGRDFSGQDLSSSRLVGTNFRGAELVGTDLSSSNAKNAVFREANLTCADLRSSALGGADFSGANLTGATLKSSGGCGSATFNNATTFCGTVMCDGSVRNDDCPGGPPAGSCCVAADCAPNETCQAGACRCGAGPACTAGRVCGSILLGGLACCDPGGTPGVCNADNFTAVCCLGSRGGVGCNFATGTCLST